MIPARAGNCRFVRRIGTGGMGQVYLARRSAMGIEQQVAVKARRFRGHGQFSARTAFDGAMNGEGGEGKVLRGRTITPGNPITGFVIADYQAAGASPLPNLPSGPSAAVPCAGISDRMTLLRAHTRPAPPERGSG